MKFSFGFHKANQRRLDTDMAVAHDITITDLVGHPFFSLVVKCSCGATLYAVDIAQAEDHKQWHLTHVKRLEALANAKQ